jgi:elongation factor G
MDFPEPVISMSIEPNTADDKKKLAEALVTIRREDPSFRSDYNDETGQTIIAGMGELHLEIIKNKLTRDMKVNVEVGKPRVSYREAITGEARTSAASSKQTGGRGQFGDASINARADHPERGRGGGPEVQDGIAFENKIVGGVDPQGVHPVGRGRRPPDREVGRLGGYPLINVKVDAGGRLVPRRRLEPGGVRAGGRPGVPRGVHQGGPACCSSRS